MFRMNYEPEEIRQEEILIHSNQMRENHVKQIVNTSWVVNKFELLDKALFESLTPK